MGGGDCASNPYNCADTPNPLPAPNTVWIEEMTWMDVRDAIKAGKTTAIISTGGIEPNGPWLVLGKHNYVLRANCDVDRAQAGQCAVRADHRARARRRIEPQSGHMASPGTISLREETFRAVLDRRRAQPEGARLPEHHLHRRQRRQSERPERWPKR